MVDFSTPKNRSSKGRTNSLFIIALSIVGLVGYAFVENTIRPPHGDRASAPQSQIAQAPD
ncbi:hypothetical protein K3729_12680 [Rhodobacteraceae bacterium S2214]|nr:hypothetical protein K3729_12680 [Rhodobacteraceae bacterium S2214]